MGNSGKGIKGLLGVAASALGLFAYGSGILGHSTEQTTNDLLSGLSEVKTYIVTKVTGVSNANTQITATSTEKSGTYTLSDGSLINLPTWSLDTYPNYYTVIGASNINTSDFPTTGAIEYSDLDSLGRTQIAKGSLTYANVEGSYGVRQSFSSEDDPSGWGNNDKVSIEWTNNKVYNGYFWNRSHLIADSLGGDAERDNVITGTRNQNVGGTDQNGGMRYTEKKAQKWLENNHSGVLYYSAEPIYNGTELIPHAVIVSMLSSDNSINEKVIVFNNANGYVIDYTNGTYHQE